MAQGLPRGERRRIEQLITKEEARVRRAFRNFLDTVKSAPVRREVRRALEAGGVDAALDVVDRHVASMGSVVTDVFTSAGVQEAQAIGNQLKTAAVALSFDPGDAIAASLMAKSRLEFITQFTTTQREATRTALAEALRTGAGTVTTARAFRDSIGLTSRQVAAVNNYRRALETGDALALERDLRDRRYDSSVRRLLQSGEPLGADRISRMVSRYRSRYLQYRAETIARTETLSIVNRARFEALNQSIDELGLERNGIIRRWIATQDARTRHTHIAMSGQERGVDEPFQSPSGVKLMYPGDRSLGAPASEVINCRCVTVFDVRDAEPSAEDAPAEPIVPRGAGRPAPIDRYAVDWAARPGLLDDIDSTYLLTQDARDNHKLLPGFVDDIPLSRVDGLVTVSRRASIPARTGVPILDEYIEELSRLVYADDPTLFPEALKRLRLDKAINREDLARIASEVAWSTPKSTSRAESLRRISYGYNVYQSAGNRFGTLLVDTKKDLAITLAMMKPLDRDMTLYRGLINMPDVSVGDELTFGGPFSTSRNPLVAADVARNNANSIILQIEAPAGTRAIAVNAAELEMLLDDGVRVVVTDIVDDPAFVNGRIVKARVLDVDYMPGVDPNRYDLLASGIPDNKPGSSQTVTALPDDQTTHRALPGYMSEMTNDSIKSYVGSGYREINNTLRTGRFEELLNQDLPMGSPAGLLRQQILDIQDLFQPAGSDMTLYRGVASNVFPDLDIGDVLEWKGFTSTSRKPYIPHSFAINAGESVLFQIELPSGYPVLVTNSKELEVLLNHGTRARVVDIVPAAQIPGVDYRDISHVYKMEILP